MSSTTKEQNNLNTINAETLASQLLQEIDKLRTIKYERRSMSTEMRTLEFWRAIIAECLATFFYVFLVCAVQITWTGTIGEQPNHAVIALTTGFAMATLTQCFGHISGAHVNPSVTFSLLITRKITPLRAALYVIAQCGGSIAGAALLYGVSIPGHQGALGISKPHDVLGPWQIFGVEFVLTFLVVFTIFATLDANKRSMGSDSLSIGIAYLVCSLTGLPSSGASMNPVRTLGPAFVMNRWKYHWVYWIAPITGGMLAALIYHFIFDTKKMNSNRNAYEFEKESHQESDSECDVKANNKKSSSSVITGVNNAGITYSTSATSSNSSAALRSNHSSFTAMQGSNIYDNYTTAGASMAGEQLGSAHYQQTLTLPSNNYYYSTATYDGIYNTRNPHLLKSLPKMDFISTKGITANGQTKF